MLGLEGDFFLAHKLVEAFGEGDIFPERSLLGLLEGWHLRVPGAIPTRLLPISSSLRNVGLL